MREINVDEIVEALEKLFIEANLYLPEDHISALREAHQNEESEIGREVLKSIIENAQVAKEEKLPVCQDTGVATIFMKVGQDVHFVGGNLEDAINEGVRRAYRNGYLRASMCDPITRKNTGDNTPAIVHYEIVPGDRVEIIALPKGGGSENYSESRVLSPHSGKEGIKRFVLEMVEKAGPNPCPPVVIGIGIGGNLEKSAILAKEALTLPYGKRNEDPEISKLEEEILAQVNGTGIGPQGFGGKFTALDVHIKKMPCHIASLPVSVVMQCHAHRMKRIVI